MPTTSEKTNHSTIHGDRNMVVQGDNNSVVVQVVDRYFNAQKREEDLLSIGLAFAYYYNFLFPFSEVFAAGEFKLYQSKDDPSPRTFTISQLNSMRVILPKTLTASSMENSAKEFSKALSGGTYFHQNNRWYGINYTVDNDSEKPLTIVDLARPLMSVEPYYRKIAGFNTTDINDETWQKTLENEKQAFMKVLLECQRMTFSKLSEKISFEEVS